MMVTMAVICNTPTFHFANCISCVFYAQRGKKNNYNIHIDNCNRQLQNDYYSNKITNNKKATTTAKTTTTPEESQEQSEEEQKQ